MASKDKKESKKSKAENNDIFPPDLEKDFTKIIKELCRRPRWFGKIKFEISLGKTEFVTLVHLCKNKYNDENKCNNKCFRGNMSIFDLKTYEALGKKVSELSFEKALAFLKKTIKKLKPTFKKNKTLLVPVPLAPVVVPVVSVVSPYSPHRRSTDNPYVFLSDE